MNIPELQKKVADVLGVSSSQKELAFEIFIDTVASILTEGITLKTAKIGFFQLKNGSIETEGNKSLIFSSLPEDFTREDKNLYLTIDVLQKSKAASEYDSNVFSIGVGKPLLPLTMDEMPDSETSYAMLRKSIEERVKELISESDQIPNFNIWDDYHKTDSETDMRFQDPVTVLNGINIDKDFVLPGLGRSNASKSNDNNNILSSLIVDIPDFIQQNENQKEVHLNNTYQTPSKDDGDEFVIIKGVDPLSYGITIDDLLDDNEDDNNVGNAESIEFEIPDSDLSKILIEEPLATQPESNSEDVRSTEETISLNDFLDNSNYREETIDLNEYLNNKLNINPEGQISLKDLGLDRDSIEKFKLLPEEEIELSSGDRVFNQFGDESGKQYDTYDKSFYETDKEIENENGKDQKPVDNFKIEIDEDNERIEKSIYDFTIEINDKNEPIDDHFEDLISSSKNAGVTDTNPFDSFEAEVNQENEGDLKYSIEKELDNKEELNSVRSELDIDELEDFKTKSAINQESKDPVSVDYNTSNEIPVDPQLKKVDEFEIIDWPDPMEVKNHERIDWNWGDELKEEFGLGGSETEDIAFEEVDDFIENEEHLINEDEGGEQELSKKDLFSRLEQTLETEVTSLHEIEDEIEEQELSKKDLFSNLKKTLETEVTSPNRIEDEIKAPKIQNRKIPDENPKVHLTDLESKSGRNTLGDIKIKNDEKVFLEFQGPPPKYQFVEDKSQLNDKKMAITLSPDFFEELRQESSKRITREKSTYTGTFPVSEVKKAINKELDYDLDSHPKRENYIKTFSIIISTLIVVGTVVVFFFIRNDSNLNQTVYNKPIQQESIQKPLPLESQESNNSQQIQTQTPSKTNSNINLDESSDFPASATPPVPIKDQATDLPPSSPIKKKSQTELKQSSSENNLNKDNIEKSSKNNGLYRTLPTDTKVNSTIYYDGKSYNFQASSWRDRLKAETEVKRLRALGMTAFIVEAYLPQKGGKWFRVRVGSFNSEKQAEEYKTKNNLN